MKYVVAFNRDRDFYQLPAALSDVGKLEALVTDIYLPEFLQDAVLSRMLGIAHRYSEAVPSSLVKSSPQALWLQIIALRMAKSEHERSQIFNRLDANLSFIAGRLALRSGAGLFLYSGYALEAFQMVQDTDLPRLIFVYHPQGDYVRRILEEDFSHHAEVAISHRRHMEEITINEGDRVAEEIRSATGISCASSFTAESIRANLTNQQMRIAVVPYGCFTQRKCRLDIVEEVSRAQVLFVGQGTQRKGLHHLLKVWADGFEKVADLTLVLNQLDPGIAALLNALPIQPRIFEGLSRDKLIGEFQRADIFVLPSLVEGFGLVYLEALAAGCHVIGTSNTGLPDLAAPAEAATIIQAGDLDHLRSALEIAIGKAAASGYDHDSIRAFAAIRTWDHFRAGIRNFVKKEE
jgi:glycosyltransferase involved in cell wall biosynthesis